VEFKKSTQLDTIYHDARTIRRHVFVEEQGIAEKLEFDGSDNGATFFVAYENGRPVATARATATAAGVHIQRVATEKAVRHRGYAKQLLQYLLADSQFKGTKRFYLGAQETAVGFYETLGFKVFGKPFIEVGIKHVNMEKVIR
jgi:predicted GNAT family N-acyltransferase